MKTGQLHNDPYCFSAIEKEMFAGGELPGGGAAGADVFGRLGRLFSGQRGKG